jgi:hypothetical protein
MIGKNSDRSTAASWRPPRLSRRITLVDLSAARPLAAGRFFSQLSEEHHFRRPVRLCDSALSLERSFLEEKAPGYRLLLGGPSFGQDLLNI